MDRRWKRQRMLPCHWPLDFHAWLWFWWFWKQFGVALPGLLAYSSRWWNQRYLCWRYGEPFVDVDRRVQAGAVLFPANASVESEPAIVKTEGNYRYALIWSWALCTATSKRVDINNLCLTWFRIKFEERHVAPAVCPMFNILMSWLYLTACICVWLTAHVCRALNYICLRFASMQSVTYRFSCNPRHIKGRDKLIEMLLVCCAFVCTSARQYQLQTKIRLSSKGSQFAGNHHLFALPFTRLNVRGRRSFSYTIKKAAIEWKKKHRFLDTQFGNGLWIPYENLNRERRMKKGIKVFERYVFYLYLKIWRVYQYFASLWEKVAIERYPMCPLCASMKNELTYVLFGSASFTDIFSLSLQILQW